MVHLNGWCFRGICKGDLWEDDLHVSALKREYRQIWGFVNEKANGTLFR